MVVEKQPARTQELPIKLAGIKTDITTDITKREKAYNTLLEKVVELDDKCEGLSRQIRNLRLVVIVFMIAMIILIIQVILTAL